MISAERLVELRAKVKKRNGKEKLCGAWFKRFNE